MRFDVAVIGGGIAGASTAANLASDMRVVLLEREDQPGYHATGRSSALYLATYGNAAIRALTRASRGSLFAPPDEFSAAPLTAPRGLLYIASALQRGALDAFTALPDVAPTTRTATIDEACALCPCLRREYVAAALYEPDARDIDVHALQQAYLRKLRAAGGRVVTGAEVTALERANGAWSIATTAGSFSARVVVNAAGAWADEIAGLAGAKPIGIQPLRRSACVIDAPDGAEVAHWPVVVDIDEQFYFKPDAGRLLLSPADETPSAPCDAVPEDLDIALAVDRVERATTLAITRVARTWAGLRSFVADRSPVIGYDSRVGDFFWVAALGGYGIQTSPAVGRLAAALIRRFPVPVDLATAGLDVDALSPQRLTDKRSPRDGDPN